MQHDDKNTHMQRARQGKYIHSMQSDLHDHDTQHAEACEHLLEMLSAIKLHIHALQGVLQQDNPNLDSVRGGLFEVEQIAQAAIAEIRADEDEKPLPELSGISLVEALTRAIEDTAEALGLSSRVAFTGEERPLPAYNERTLYRIVQEALYQVRQHRNAHRLRFTFNYGHDEAQMSIEDDGLALSPDTGTGDVASDEEVADMPIPHFRIAGRNGIGGRNDEDRGNSIGGRNDEDRGNSMDGGNGSDGRNALRPYITLIALRHRLTHLGGSLEITALPAQGTRVYVRLPYNAPVGAQFIAPVPIASQQQISVLIVDNLAVLRAGLRRLLESYPDLHIVGEAADGVQAVSETLELGPHVVLLDANLSNRQSIEALQQIKQVNPDTRVLLLAVEEREEILYQALRAGADGYLLKDAAPDELAQSIRAVARGEVSVQQQLASRLLSHVGKQGRPGYPYEALTAREREVLQLLARGLRNKEIAARLTVSERTVNFHLANIYQKLNVSGRTEALSKALEQGLITA
jgi:DNA-binding NarL/FixJ family response regulator